MRRRRSGADRGVVGSLRSCADRSSRTLIESNWASISGQSDGRNCRLGRLSRRSVVCIGMVDEERRDGTGGGFRRSVITCAGSVGVWILGRAVNYSRGIMLFEYGLWACSTLMG
ncbi:hypothetical protein ACFX2I_045716 [Malus domestica]